VELAIPELARRSGDPEAIGDPMNWPSDKEYPTLARDVLESRYEPHTGDMREDLGVDYLDCPRPLVQEMVDRNLWAVPPHLFLRHTVEEIQDACKVCRVHGAACPNVPCFCRRRRF
jgi:hypothetical protein